MLFTLFWTVLNVVSLLEYSNTAFTSSIESNYYDHEYQFTPADGLQLAFAFYDTNYDP